METEIVFIYCLADSMTQALGLKDEPRAKMTHAEIITFVMISAVLKVHWQYKYFSGRRTSSLWRVH